MPSSLAIIRPSVSFRAIQFHILPERKCKNINNCFTLVKEIPRAALVGTFSRRIFIKIHNYIFILIFVPNSIFSNLTTLRSRRRPVSLTSFFVSLLAAYHFIKQKTFFKYYFIYWPKYTLPTSHGAAEHYGITTQR